MNERSRCNSHSYNMPVRIGQPIKVHEKRKISNGIIKAISSNHCFVDVEISGKTHFCQLSNKYAVIIN